MHKIICEYCEEEFTQEQIEKGEFFYIYNLVVNTDKQTHYIGLQKVLTELGDVLMDKKIHLSASQILLFRPDILKHFLEKIKQNEKILSFYLQKYIICLDCYDEFTKLIPLL